MSELVSFYRISDVFQKDPAGKQVIKPRPAWFDKRKCFLNFLSVFGTSNLIVIADGVGQQTMDWLLTLVPENQIRQTDYLSGAFSFLHAAHMAAELPQITQVALIEDDYIWTPDAKKCIIEALDIADYATPYDAGDKYIDAGSVGPTGTIGNPLIQGKSEVTRVYLTDSTHWKETNSTTCTFAATAGMIKDDLTVYNAFSSSGFPMDYAMFRHLVTQKGRRLVSPIPSKATHCESAYLSPLIDWEAVLNRSLDAHACVDIDKKLQLSSKFANT